MLDKDYFIAFDGEIYNKEKIIKKIEDKGEKVKDNSNEEVFLKSFMIFGTEGI